MKRVASLLAAASVLGGGAALVLSDAAATASPSASAAGVLPTMIVSLTGTNGVLVSGSTVSGAVRVVSTHTGKGRGQYGLVRLHPGVSIQQAFGAVQSHHGDINALTPYGSLMVDAGAPSTIQTVLTPGSYVALNISGNGKPAFEQFTVSRSPSPAALPGAKATETAIEFGFRGSKVLHDGTMVRSRNGGYLVHMVTLLGARNQAAGHALVHALRAGQNRKAHKLSNGRFVDLLGPASPGAMQQQVLHAKPGYYVEACFMNTEDGREHVRLGMERLVRIVK